MATYREAEQLMRQLKPIIDREIETHPLIRSAIKVKKAVVQKEPDTTSHTVAVKFLPDLFDRDASPLIFPYNPALLASDLEVGKPVYVFYYQSLGNGIVMQNATWTASGADERGGDSVDSVNGMTGEVVLTASDLGISSWAQAENKPSYSWNEITGKPDVALKSELPDMDAYVKKSGDTMSGKLNFSPDGGVILNGYNFTTEFNYAGIKYGENVLNFPRASGTFALKEEIPDTSNFVTLDTKQYINGEKTFDDAVYVSDSDTLRTGYSISGITRSDSSTQTEYTCFLPNKGGTFALKEDLTWANITGKPTIPSTDDFVTLDTYQTITGNKWFGQGITVSHGITADDDTDVFAVLNPRNITWCPDDEFVLNFPMASGTLALKEEIPDTSNFVTIDTEQTITAKKTFADEISVSDGASTVNVTVGAIQFNDNYSGKLYTYRLPQQTGTFALLDDLPDLSLYVTLDTQQRITGNKIFVDSLGIQPEDEQRGVTFTPSDIVVNDGRGTFRITYPSEAGTLALKSDIPSLSVSNSGSGNAVTSITADGHTVTVTKGLTFALKEEIPDTSNFVTLDTEQTILGRKTFDELLIVSDGESDVRLGLNSIGHKNADQQQFSYRFPEASGTFALKEDLTWANITGKPSWIGSSKPTYTWTDIQNKPTFADVAVSGSYSDLKDKPTIPTIPNIIISNSGSGNAVTSIAASGHTLTVTKGSTFALKSELTWGKITDKPTIPSTDNFVTIDTAQTIMGRKTFDDYVNISDGESSVVLGANGISHQDADSRQFSYLYPSESGTLALKEDISAYTLPQATSSELGGIKIGATGLSGKQYPVQLNSGGQAYVSVPWTDNDTHHTAYLYLSNLSTTTSQTSGSISNPYMNLVDGGIRRTSIQLVGGTGVTVSATGTSAAGRTVTISGFSGDYNDLTNKPTIPTIPNLSVSNSGSGNAVTAITASGHSLTVTKGQTFALKSELTWANITGKPTIPSTDNFVTLDTAQTITGTKTFGNGTGSAHTQIVLKPYDGSSPTDTYGVAVQSGSGSTTLQSGQIIRKNGSQSYLYTFPNQSGTLALKEDAGGTPIDVQHDKVDLLSTDEFQLSVPSKVGQTYIYFINITSNAYGSQGFTEYGGQIDILGSKTTAHMLPNYFRSAFDETQAEGIITSFFTLTLQRTTQNNCVVIYDGITQLNEDMTVLSCSFPNMSSSIETHVSWVLLSIG